MAKKRNKKNRTKPISPSFDEKVLPQNILSLGERVEENKNIYISQQVYKEIHRFTKNKTTNESGGILIGYVLDEFGKTNIVINGFIEAKYCEATPTTLKFTHETWEYVHKEMDKKFPNKKIVGWIHTHPDFGIFLSEYDKFIHENFFSDAYQIAYVVDPIQNIEGFYFWINNNLERCKGFYVYDKTGVKINLAKEKEQIDISKTQSKSIVFLKNILIGIMAFLILLLYFYNMSQNKEIEKIQKQQETLTESANQSLAIMQQQINVLSTEVSKLQQLLESSVSNEQQGDSTEQADSVASEHTSEKEGVSENE